MPLRTLWIHVRIPRHSLGEFPHSDICGSMLIYSSPQLFAVSHVLHRRQVPRHPPYALRSLIIKASFDASKSYNVLSLVCILSKISYIVNRSYYSLLFILDIYSIDEIPYHPVIRNLLCSCQCAFPRRQSRVNFKIDQAKQQVLSKFWIFDPSVGDILRHICRSTLVDLDLKLHLS